MNVLGEVLTLSNLIFLGKGLLYTVSLSLISIAVGFVIATFLSISRYSKVPVLGPLAFVYTEVIRNTPLVLLLFLSVFGFPALGIQVSLFIKVVVAIIVFNTALLAEIIRGGLNSVEKGQIEAARSQGLTKIQTLVFIICPQAFWRMIPPIVSQFITVIKDTSYAAPLGLMELFGSSSVLWNQHLDWLFPLLFIITLFYFILNYSLSSFSLWLEKHIDETKRAKQVTKGALNIGQSIRESQ